MTNPFKTADDRTSRTLVFNILSIAALVASGRLGIHLPPDIAAIVLAVVNIGLRFVTTQPLALAARSPTS